MACVLLEISEYIPIFSSINEYCKEIDKLCRRKKSVEYNGDGSAKLQWI